MRFVKKIRIRPSQLVLFGDQFLLLLGLFTSLLAYYRILSITEFPLHTILYRSLIHLSIGVICWFVFRIYKKMIRFFNSTDYLSLVAILLLIHVSSFVVGYFLPDKHRLLPEIYLISFFITSIYIVVSRFCISFLYLHYRKTKKVKGTRGLLIYGTGNLGVFLKKNIIEAYSNEYRLVGFLDNNPYNIDRSIGGFKVFDANGDLKQLAIKHGVTDIIIAKTNMPPAEKSHLLEQMLELNIRVREMMPVNNMFSKFNMEKLAVLDINDLMNREAIQLYGEHVAEYLKGKSALVTGAAGSIGSEIVRKLAEHRASPIICVDFSESALYDLQQELTRKHQQIKFKFILADIRNEEIVDLVFKKYQPNVIYHAAAYKHVPMMEHFPWQAIQTNVFATWLIAQKAIEYRADKFVFISSDKAVNPTSVMGATKRLAEVLVQSLSAQRANTSFVVTRFGNVLGSNGSVVPLFKKQIQEGGPVTVTHPEMTRYFMTIAEACQLVLEASVMAQGGEIFVFDMGKPVKILDLAKNMIRLAGFAPDGEIKIEFTGLRPGEKLFEDLFSEKEKMKETYHEKILISHESAHEVKAAEIILSRLASLENVYEPGLFRKVIQELLPEYTPENMEDQVLKIKAGTMAANPIAISNIASVN